MNALEQLLEERDRLLEFKRYVHMRLDAAGVPANPEPELNAEHGCRIEGRLNWILRRLRLMTMPIPGE